MGALEQIKVKEGEEASEEARKLLEETLRLELAVILEKNVERRSLFASAFLRLR